MNVIKVEHAEDSRSLLIQSHPCTPFPGGGQQADSHTTVTRYRTRNLRRVKPSFNSDSRGQVKAATRPWRVPARVIASMFDARSTVSAIGLKFWRLADRWLRLSSWRWPGVVHLGRGATKAKTKTVANVAVAMPQDAAKQVAAGIRPCGDPRAGKAFYAEHGTYAGADVVGAAPRLRLRDQPDGESSVRRAGPLPGKYGREGQTASVTMPGGEIVLGGCWTALLRRRGLRANGRPESPPAADISADTPTSAFPPARTKTPALRGLPRWAVLGSNQ